MFFKDSSILCNEIIFWTNFWQLSSQFHHMFITCTVFYNRYTLFEFFCEYKLLGFVDSYVSNYLWISNSWLSKFVYSFGSHSLKLEQGSRVVYFTVLAPRCTIREGWFREMWYIFVKPIVIPKFESSDFNFCFHITYNYTMKFFL